MKATREHRRNDPSDAGFTLLELLVAMTLLGLLMTVVFGGLRFGARAWERAETDSSGTDEIRLAQSILRHELELTYPKFVLGDLRRPHIDFEGTADGVTFLSPAPTALEVAGRATIAIRRTTLNGRIALALSARHELALDSTPADTEVLVDDLRALEFSYYGSQGRDDTPNWHNTWENQTRVPDLIRIQATFGDRRRVWPDLIVAPRISEDVGCIYDVLINNCRGR
jgi:general secretion pathway protein J